MIAADSNLKLPLMLTNVDLYDTHQKQKMTCMYMYNSNKQFSWKM